ncbi:MAG: heme A synthase [Actinomycetia bacterium]|nr:heme A synthase [Actinomycetes bacterium]
MARILRSRTLTPERYRLITLVALIALGGIVLTGGAVRLSSSGLGCEDWPKCSEDALVPEWGFHEWVEFGNRLLTGVVSAAVIAADLGSMIRNPRRRDLTWWSWGLVAGVIGQVVLGGLLVKADLDPRFSMGHFLLSSVLIWNAVVLHLRAAHPGTPGVPLVGPNLVRAGRATTGLATLGLFTGAVVTAAGPHGGDDRAERLDIALVTVTRVHSVVVWVFLAVLVMLGVGMARSGAPRRLLTLFQVTLALSVMQGVVGYLQYATALPPALVEVHLLGTVLVWCAVLYLHLALFDHPEPAAPVDLTDSRSPTTVEV